MNYINPQGYLNNIVQYGITTKNSKGLLNGSTHVTLFMNYIRSYNKFEHNEITPNSWDFNFMSKQTQFQNMNKLEFIKYN